MKWKFVSGAKHKSKTFGGLLILSIVRQVFWISTIWCSSNYEQYLGAITMPSLRLNICHWGKLRGARLAWQVLFIEFGETWTGFKYFCKKVLFLYQDIFYKYQLHSKDVGKGMFACIFQWCWLQASCCVNCKVPSSNFEWTSHWWSQWLVKQKYFDQNKSYTNCLFKLASPWGGIAGQGSWCSS